MKSVNSPPACGGKNKLTNEEDVEINRCHKNHETCCIDVEYKAGISVGYS
jgi:hypothetical protein